MNLTLDPSSPFWHELAQARRERRPRAWTLPFGALPVTPEEAFSALVACSERKRRREPALDHRIYAGKEPVPATDDVLATAADGSMAGYVARLDAQLGEAGFVVNDFQAADPRMWGFACEVLAGLRRHLGVTLGGASFDLFAGAYRTGFFGVHKDDQAVITFVVEGRKRFLLWPYEALKDHPGVGPGLERKPCVPEGVDLEQLRASAIVIEGGPGDVFYWPVDFWHVAEADGGLCTTVGVGLFDNVGPLELLQKSARELLDEGLLELPETLTEVGTPAGGDEGAFIGGATAQIGRVLESPALWDRLEQKCLMFKTSFGMGKAPPPPPPLELSALRGRTVSPLPGLVAWTVRGDELLWSVGGVIFRYPAALPLIRIVARLSEGRPVPVDGLLADVLGLIDEDAALHVIELVHRHHGLALEEPARIAEAAETTRRPSPSGGPTGAAPAFTR